MSDPHNWSPRIRAPIGAKVVLVREVDRYPDFQAPEGLTGVIVFYDGEMISVRMDKPLKGAEPWDNEIQWHIDSSLDEFRNDVRLVK